MNWEILTQRLPNAVAGPLPGMAAHARMFPRTANGELRYRPPNGQEKPSGVLLLLVRNPQNEAEILLTLRNRSLGSHGGQISFPGGRLEPNETPEAAALREAREEVGLDSEKVRVVGPLSSLYVYVSNSLIHPTVAVLEAAPVWQPNPEEVEEVFLVPIRTFLSPERWRSARRTLGSEEYDVPFFDVHPHVPLWGATAMIMAELLEILDPVRA